MVDKTEALSLTKHLSSLGPCNRLSLLLFLPQPVMKPSYISRHIISITSTISTVSRTTMRSYNATFKIPAAMGEHPKKTLSVTYFLLSTHSSICHCDIQLSRLFRLLPLHILIFLLHKTISH